MSETPRPRRSALYVPASNPRAIDKAETIGADVIIFDLEDSVTPEAKDTARDAVVGTVAADIYGHREVVIRINGLDTPWIARDIAGIASCAPDAILVPKLSKIEHVRRVRTALAAAQVSAKTKLWVMIETPLAILNAGAIAAMATMPGAPIACFVIGLNDLAAETGMRLKPGRAAAFPFLAQALAAARAYDLAILDGTFNALEDDEGCRAECEQGRDLGFDGKTLIHPRQVPIANEVFGPTLAEVTWAGKVIAAFAKPDNNGKGVIALDGQMVERLHERQARRVMEMAKAISAIRPSA
jgi:citrate lyase subunit beta / citryl-CoA lyase